MKTLKNLVKTETLNVEELMSIKGAAAIASGCDTLTCTENACKDTACVGTGCHSNTCGGTSCGGQSCNTNKCISNSGSNIYETMCIKESSRIQNVL